ncbi:MAG: ABC transporter permease [Gemmatimonadales bacterium]
METLVRDVRYAFRSLVRAPLFAVAAVLTLALGIGANTAVFSVVRGVLLRPLPHADGERLVYLRQSADLAGIDNALFSVPEIIDYREASAFTGIGEFSAGSFNLTARGEPQQVLAGIVSGNFFEVMGLAPELGRLFDEGDDGAAAAPVVVLTYDYWMQAFGGDPGVIGEAVELGSVVGGASSTIVGVLQRIPQYPEQTDIFVNMVTSEHHLSATMVHGRTHRMTEVFGRLAPGSSIAQAQAEIDGISARVYDAYPEAYEAAAGYRITVSPLADILTQRATGTIYLLWTTAAFVLLIALASVANLVLTRSIRRERELVVRAALGAGAARLRRLLLVESVLLALAGSGLGFIVALAGTNVLTTFAARFTPRATEIALDGTVLAFTAGVAAVVALALAWAPSLPGETAGVGPSLASAGTRTTVGRRYRRMQRGLVVAQVALSVTLLTGAGLLVRTLLNLYDLDVGADLEGVLTVEVPLAGTGRASPEVRLAYEQMRTEMATLPGVTEAGVGSAVPLRDNEFQLEIKAEGVPPNPDEPTPTAEYRTATPEYFRATGIPLVAGREFESTDTRGAALVVILNQAAVDRLFPGRDPLGQRVAWTGDVLNFIPVSGDWRTVVGVVGNTRSATLDADPRPAMYQPFEQEEVFAGSLVVRASSDPEALLVPATQIVRSVDPTVPIGKVGTLAELRDESVASQRINAVLVSGFGAVALLIAAVGLAGVLGFSVSQRINEIGVRMSLGAHPSQVRRMIVREGVTLLVIGLAIGGVASVFASRVVGGMLYGVAPNDPTTLVAVALLMGAVGVVAAWVPAMRASTVQPVEALRRE